MGDFVKVPRFSRLAVCDSAAAQTGIELLICGDCEQNPVRVGIIILQNRFKLARTSPTWYLLRTEKLHGCRLYNARSLDY